MSKLEAMANLFKPEKHGAATFTLDEVMDALSDAFAATHPRWARDCEVESKFKAILTRRAGASSDEGKTPVASDEDNGG